MRQLQHGTGLESAPDIMLLMMAALMVAIVWLSSLSHETALPPIDLPSSESAGLGTAQAAAVAVTLSPGPEGTLEVFVEQARVVGGLEGLVPALEQAGAGAVVLRADAATPWQDGLTAMAAAAKLGLSVSVAVDP